jgi:hypothetical protein
MVEDVVDLRFLRKWWWWWLRKRFVDLNAL